MKDATDRKGPLMNFDPNQIAQKLTASIRLSLPPIAICFTEKVPAGIRTWTGRVPAGCRFWQEAATEVFATSSSDHDLCAIGTFTHNLETTEAHEADRRDFYLYVDEFQNFITDAFSSILSEARKYHLNLIIAHQYLGQLEQSAGAAGAGSKDVRDAVFGNAGTEICFRIGVEDAETMAKEFSPVFNDFDLVNIDRYNAYVKLMINGTASKPFNMATIAPAGRGSPEMATAIRQLSRLKYGRPRAEVESDILESSRVAEAMSKGSVPVETGLK